MALQKGEKYRCTDPQCGYEIEVTKGAAPGKAGIWHLDAVAAEKSKKLNVALLDLRFAIISM
jgi:hypothetical protein